MFLIPNHLYTYILNIYDLVWFGLVLWHINHCRLFNAKSSLYMYIKYMICKHILLITFLNAPELTFYTQLNVFKYFYLKRISQFIMNHLSVHI